MNENTNDNDAVAEPAQEEEVVAAAETSENASESKSGNQVPVRELQKERRERQRLEKQLADFQKQQEEARQAELSEVDKLREQLEKTQQEAQAAHNARVLAEQQSLVRSAASKNGFADVNDAITFVNFETLTGLEGEELNQAVADEVLRVSEDKPYLLTTSEKKSSVGKASDREGADNPPVNDEDALGGFVHGLLFGKK
jgi:hypothetical protein